MPAKKKYTVKKKTTNTKNTNTTAKKTNTGKNSKKPVQKSNELSGIHYFIPWIIALITLFVVICLFFTEYSGFVGKGIHALLLGLFSGGAYAVPVALGAMAFFWKTDARNYYLKYRMIYSFITIVSLSAFIHSFSTLTKTFKLETLWVEGNTLRGGGVLGGLFGSALHFAIGKPGLIILSVILLFVFGIFLIGFTPSAVAKHISVYISEKREERKRNRPERRPRPKPEVYLPEDDDEYGNPVNEIDIDAPIVDETPVTDPPVIPGVKEPVTDIPLVDPEIFERIKQEINENAEASGASAPKGQKKFPDEEGVITDASEGALLDDAANELIEKAGKAAEELVTEHIPLTDEPEEEKPEDKPKEKPVYVFPPIDLLSQTENPRTEDVTEELRANAQKLVETLSSFKVRTKIIDISRGPAITRYELQPEEGVRVRQIANLVDDIALNLATSGIRIEAPIPGKAAVGIEVPNKVRAVVGLREQLESPNFINAKSRLTASLGVDVAGEPVYMDIAKMPHLLVAGATGQGKSVCINSIIVSMLYKATPDEVKLILIDPKKVEFVPYNGLPHLLVPVVTDPKKAAGSLQWAVGEMERRYQLMESLGVRDIHNFNLKTKDDPKYEFIPQVVIIIDELADLMMTAPDQVEDSICRLAQKARAAGMHLILGTQRPSVDVVTGLIKANIPSRISCKTTSQVDSRTILDMAGAEKLIGRGDMLYAPVGAAKPMRVQGSFVHEDDVTKVTDFIRGKVGESEYDTSVIEKIEQEAAKCGVKKGGSVGSADLDDDEDGDPMLHQAIELAVESGKISTSLIQRKLSLGYGRAAKLIDTMEKMGIVGAPEGNKPRQVLMTQAEFLEMTMHSEG